MQSQREHYLVATALLLVFTTALGLIVTWPSNLGHLDRDTGFQWLMILENQDFLVYPHHPVIIEILTAYQWFIPGELRIIWLSLPYLVCYILTVFLLFRLCAARDLPAQYPLLVVTIVALNPALLFQLNTLDDNLLSWPFLAGSILMLLGRQTPDRLRAFVSPMLAGIACILGTASMGWALAIGLAWVVVTYQEKSTYWPVILAGTVISLVPLVVKDLFLGLSPISSFSAMFMTPSDAYFGNYSMVTGEFNKGIRMAAAGLVASAGPLFIDPLTMVTGYTFPLRRNGSLLLILLTFALAIYAIRTQENSQKRILAATILLVPFWFYNTYMILSVDDALQERTDWIAPWLLLTVLFLNGNRSDENRTAAFQRLARIGLPGILATFGIINTTTFLSDRESFAEPEWRISELRSNDLLIREGSFSQKRGALEFGRLLSVRMLPGECRIYSPPLTNSRSNAPVSTLPWTPFPGSRSPAIPQYPKKCLNISLDAAQEKAAQEGPLILPEADRSIFSGYRPDNGPGCKGLETYLEQCNERAFVRERNTIPLPTIQRIVQICKEKPVLSRCAHGGYLDCTGSLICIAGQMEN